MTTYRIFDITRAPRDFSTQFEDFHRFLAADWLITRVGVTPTEAETDGIGGQLLITTSAANGDRDAMQFAGSAGAAVAEWAYTTGKKLQFATKLQLGNASNPAYIAGLYTKGTTDPIGIPPTNGIFFRKAAASTRLFFVLRKAGVEVALDTGVDVVAATDLSLEFYYDGTHSTIVAFVNGVRVGSLPIASAPASGTLLALSQAIQNGTAAANTMTVDYIGAQVQR